MNTTQLITEIEKTYYNHFPKSKIFVKFNTNLYRSISITCCLAGDKSENISGYWDNDILNVRFRIIGEKFKEFSKNVDLESELETVSLENYSKSYHVKPTSPYMVYSSKQLSFRKIDGNPEKIIKSLDGFFIKLKNSLLADLETDNIHPNHLELVKNKIL